MMEKSKETVKLAILDDKETVYIDKHESYEFIRLVTHIGSRYLTLHPTGVEKVFLVYISEKNCEYIISEREAEKNIREGRLYGPFESVKEFKENIEKR